MSCWSNYHAVARSVNEMKILARRYFALRLFWCVLGGVAYALALPPVNWSFLAWVCLIPVYDFILKSPLRWSWLGGWLWGVGWSVFAFQFLREINSVIPYLLAPVLSVWPALWSFGCALLWRRTIYPTAIDLEGYESRVLFAANGFSFGRLAAYFLGTAALFVVFEWTRSHLFLWNELAITQWRNGALLQLAALTGTPGIAFLLVAGNGALYCFRFKRGWRITLSCTVLVSLVWLGGALRLAMLKSEPAPDELKALLVQGDLSQRRHATAYAAREALDIYRDLSYRGIKDNPDCELIIWPESAVPLPFYSNIDLNKASRLPAELELYRIYQQTVFDLARRTGKPLLIGAIDYAESLAPDRSSGMTNSVLWITANGKIAAKYDKIHRVPFGEYIPFRRYLPERLIAAIDMGRDLLPGNNFYPMELVREIPAGLAVCYEGVFSYLMSEKAWQGAEILIVLSNDAWYPVSSEPEQHLANAVPRVVETALPMIRCGNNGGSGVVMPWGEFTQCRTAGPENRPELRRGRGAFMVKVPLHFGTVRRTWFVRHRHWFIGSALLYVAAWILWCIVTYGKICRQLLKLTAGPSPEINSRTDHAS